MRIDNSPGLPKLFPNVHEFASVISEILWDILFASINNAYICLKNKGGVLKHLL